MIYSSRKYPPPWKFIGNLKGVKGKTKTSLEFQAQPGFGKGSKEKTWRSMIFSSNEKHTYYNFQE